MTLPVSGAISLNQVNVELGLSGTTTISMNQASVRTLFGVPSGAISMSNGYGKANQFAFTISSNQTNANLRTLAVAAGWNQASALVATISGGIYISSNNTGTPALTVNGSFPGGVTLTNNGFIIGMGGNGGSGANNGGFTLGNGMPGSAGGLALSVSVAISINNAGTIGGGGGGGGGGGAAMPCCVPCGAIRFGGGGGGGRSSNAANSAGGLSYGTSSGGAGTVSSAGSGSNGLKQNTTGAVANTFGGNGGGWGSSGSSGTTVTYFGGSGGGGGGAISGNGNISWVAFGTRLGSIS